MHLTLSSYIPLSFLLLFVLRVVYNRTIQYRKLSHVPGPFLSGVSRWFFIKSTAKNTLHLACGQLCKDYGEWNGGQ